MIGRKRRRNRKEDGQFNVWRSYSDMMAGVVLLFVLIMCVTLFQAQKNYTEKIAEQEERIRIQDEYAEEMAIKQAELEEQDQLLADQKDKLAEQNLTLEEMQGALEEQAAILEEKQAILEEQQSTLEKQASILETQKNRIAEQKGELEAQKALLDEQKKLLADKQAQIDRIVGVKAEVIEALQKEFAANDIDVQIDSQTGAMVLDAKVMFAYDSAVLSDEGKQVLRQVLPIYCKVLLSAKYRDNVAEILIDGYTDTDGTYESNLELSQNRSLAVAQYLLSIQGEFLSTYESKTLQEMLTVSGHSWNNPILDAQGNVDMEASRRVEVKFRLKDEEMIEELRELTE